MLGARLPRALAALLLASVLAACGADAPTPPPAPSDGTFPVTVEHAFGTTTIERAPERVVALGVTDADPVLALGTTPVAVAGYSFYPETGLGPWAQELVRGPQPVRLASDST
ncbi:MAG: iron-siderophore ABC transporter substrate-binding protein, partial [Actinomycetes bacterium]